MTDWGASGRRDTYWAELVDPFTLDATGELDIVDGSCDVTYGYYTDHVYSGKVATIGGWQPGSLVRLWHRVEVDGDTVEEPLATMFVDKRPVKSIFGRDDTDLDCYSVLYRFSKDCFTSTYTVKKGTQVSTAIKSLVESRWGKLTIDSRTSTRTLNKDVSYENGSVMLTALNDLAGQINAEIMPDGLGNLVLQPYQAPKDKPIAYTFDAENSTYIAGYSRDDGTGESYNRALVFYSVSSGSPSTRRSVKDLPDTDPMSRQHIGMYKTIVSKLTDRVYTQAELDKLAQQLLDENKAGEDYIEIEHVGIPGLKVGDVVRYINDTDSPVPLDVNCIITEMNVSLKPGCMTKTKMRVV